MEHASTTTDTRDGWEAPARLQSALRAAVGAPVVVEITRNRSRLLSARQKTRGIWTVRVHALFLAAPPEIVDTLAGWLKNDPAARTRLRDYCRQARESELAGGDAPAAARAGAPSAGVTAADLVAAADTGAAAGSASSAAVNPRAVAYGARAWGKHHDLAVYAERLNGLYLEWRSRVPVEWSARQPKAGARSVRLGYYDPAGRRIVMSRRLDRADVPRYFVEYVLFHEMLHEVLGIGRRKDGRRDIHGNLFRIMEKTYPDYERARAYERRVWGGGSMPSVE